jgi:hypothetical protein
MTELFDPFRKLLLALCSPVKSTEQIKLSKQTLSKTAPERVLKLAAIEFLSPLLYYHLKQLNMPGYNGILPHLKDSYMKNTARNVLLLKQIKLLKKRAEQDGIQIILLKGAGLAISVYNEIGLRPMADIDILVHQQHTKRIMELMKDGNMHPLFKDTNQNWLYSIKSHIMPYQSDDNTLSLEVHTRLFDDRFIQFAKLNPFENTRTVTWDNESFLMPDPYTEFIYGLYHLAIHHNFSFRLRDIVDLQYMASYYKLVPEKIFSYIDSTHAAGLFLPLIHTAFEIPNQVQDDKIKIIGKPAKQGHHDTAAITHAYLFWTNSVVMKYLPIQLSSRLSDATLRIATVLTSGIKIWLPRIFHFTDYEVSLFYKSPKHRGMFKRAGMALWLISVAIVYAIVLPLFYIKVKVQNRS